MYPYYDVYNQYYRFNDYRNVPNQNQPANEEIITLNQAIELIKQSVGDEKEDEIFYDELIRNAPNKKEKDIIASIRDDERKHNQILRNLYYKYTGTMLPKDTSSPIQSENSRYKDQLEKALFGELEAVKRYRRIMGAMPDNESKTLLMSIMTDEIRHANKYNFLITSQGK